MTFASDPEIDKAYRPSAALAPGTFEANMLLYRERSAEAYRTLPHAAMKLFKNPGSKPSR